MAFGSVTLQPGVNVEKTPVALRAGISASSLIRFRDSLVQKLGGWLAFYPFNVAGVPRDLHAWQDLNGNKYLGVGTTTQLVAIRNGVLGDISPQTLTSDLPPIISTTSGSPIVNITDANASGITTNDSVFFNVPVSHGGLILFGFYQVTLVTGLTSFEITAATNATITETNPTATNATTASGNPTLHFAATPAWVQNFMVVADITTPSAIPAGTYVTGEAGTTVTMSNNAAGAGVGNGDNIVFTSIPIFLTTTGSSVVSVKLINHNLAIGATFMLQIATVVGGLTLLGAYQVTAIVDANTFQISGAAQAATTATVAMNNGQMELVYYIALGPPPAGTGFGLGGFGSGGFGVGTSTTALVGADLAAIDYTLDNWGEIFIACPKNRGIFYWDPTSGFSNAQIIPGAPVFNAGAFVSTSEQILVAFGSSVAENIGVQQQSLLVQWSDAGNFFQWTPLPTNQAGNFVIPIGSAIVAGAAVSNQNLLWTDLDLWAMNYLGPPLVFGFNKIGAGMGAVSAHAVQQLRGSAIWMSRTNFCGYTANGAQVIPCPVWDAVFQNLNTDFLQNIRSMPNTAFNEAGWLFPSADSDSGENDSYVKFNIIENGAPWDIGIGALNRSAWIDQSVLGFPIGATSSGGIFQHETSPDANGSPVMASFTTGYFFLEEGENFVIVDQVLPDFKWSTFTGDASAQIQLSFNVIGYPNDTPITYGPYLVTSTTKFISTRFRGRMMSITVSSSDIGSFWRLGSCKYRYAPAGRR
jgi:hypothetical protein